MRKAEERVTRARSGDRQARLARALRENLKRRKAQVRAGTTPDTRGHAAGPDVDAPDQDAGRRGPAAKRD
jgi:hypothetical protein